MHFFSNKKLIAFEGIQSSKQQFIPSKTVTPGKKMTNYFIALHEKNLFSETSGCFVKQPELQGRMTGTLNQTRKMKDLNDSRHCRVFTS